MNVYFFLLLTAILWGSSPILEKMGLSRATAFAAVTIRSIVITSILIIIMFLTNKTKEVFLVSPKTILIFATSGIMAGLAGMWTYFMALKMGATSRVVPIAATYPLVTALLSFIILQEKFTVIRFIGTIVIVCGIWLVKID